MGLWGPLYAVCLRRYLRIYMNIRVCSLYAVWSWVCIFAHTHDSDLCTYVCMNCLHVITFMCVAMCPCLYMVYI